MATRMDASSDDADPDRLTQMSQMLEHLQSQLDELDRREQLLNRKISIADEKQVSLRNAELEFKKRTAQIERSLADETRELQEKDRKLQQAIDSFEIKSKQFSQADSSLRKEKQEFESLQKQSAEELKSKVDAELAARRKQLDAEFEKTKHEFEVNSQEIQQKFEQDNAQQRADLKLQFELLSKEKSRHQQDISEWNHFKSEELKKLQATAQAEIEEAKKALLANTDQLEMERKQLDEEKAAWNSQAEAQKTEAKNKLVSDRKQFEDECRALRQQLETDFERQRAALATEKMQLEQNQAKHLSQVADWESSLDQQRQAFDEELQNQLTIFEEQCRKTEAELNNELIAKQETLNDEYTLKKQKLEERYQTRAALLEQEKAEFLHVKQMLEADLHKQSEELKAFASHLDAENFALSESCQALTQLLHKTSETNQECAEYSAILIELNGEVQQSEFYTDLTNQIFAFQQAQATLKVKTVNWEEQRDKAQAKFDAILQERRLEFEKELDGEKQTLSEQHEQLKRAVEDQLAGEQELLLLERKNLRDEISKEIEEDKTALKQAWTELELARREQERLNEQWSEQRTLERTKIFAEMEEAKKEKLSALDQREKNLQRREIDLQKRAKLHEQHLEKVRNELKSQQTENEKRRQKQQVWKEEVEQGIRRRLNHMKRFRDLMTQREECLTEEQELFQKTRQSAEREATRTREQFMRDRENWEQQRLMTVDRLKNREELLDQEYASLTESHQRVTDLSEELEEIIEKASHSTVDYSPQTARHLNGLLGILGRQKREADQSIQSLQKQLIELRTESTELSSWVEQRDELVTRREQNHQRNLETLTRREEEFEAAQEVWNQDRMQAERVIRELVVQLEVALDQIARQNVDPSQEPVGQQSRNAA